MREQPVQIVGSANQRLETASKSNIRQGPSSQEIGNDQNSAGIIQARRSCVYASCLHALGLGDGSPPTSILLEGRGRTNLHTGNTCGAFTRSSTPPPWVITPDPMLHPPNADGIPTILPGQPIQGTWSVVSWTCEHLGRASSSDRRGGTYHWISNPDPSHSRWTLELGFEGHNIVPPSIPGVGFIGTPDFATQANFYQLGGLSTSPRRLTVILRDEHGNVVDSGHVFVIALVSDRSNEVVFDSSAPADGTVFFGGRTLSPLALPATPTLLFRGLHTCL